MRRAVTLLLLVLALADAPSITGSPPSRPHFIPQSVSFVSASLGWAWGPAYWPTGPFAPGVLARTDDGGRTWTVLGPRALRYAASDFVRADTAVRFLDRHRGYLFGGLLLATADGGRSWRIIPPAVPVIDVEALAGRAYALTSTRLYRITDRLVPVGPAFRSASTLVVRGEAMYLLASRRLWSSSDAGRSWRRLSDPCTAPTYFPALAAWSARGLALACGLEPGAGNEAKTFYISTDGGASWRLTGRIGFTPGKGFTPGYVASLTATDARTWVLGEARGGIMVSHDSGRTWRWATFTGPVSGGVEGWGSVSFIDATHLVAVPWTLNGDVLAFSADAGEAWQEVSFGR